MLAYPTHMPVFSATPPIPVALSPCHSYSQSAVDIAVFSCLDAIGWVLPYGCRVLVKPNLLRADPLSCTNPQVVRAACQWLLDRHCTVTVADSPGFGTAAYVAQSIGLTAALKPLGLVPMALEAPVPVPLPSSKQFSKGLATPCATMGLKPPQHAADKAGCGMCRHACSTQDWHHPWKHQWGVSTTALHSDYILSVPRVKAHCQMRVTLSVKNLFGCVCAWRKAIAHTVQGASQEHFTAALVDLWAALPPVVALADGITAMHKTGPSGGEPYPLGCVGASSSAVALDTAFYTMLGQQPCDIPLWAELCRRKIAGASPEDLTFPLAQSYIFDAGSFEVPAHLMDVSFQPHRLLLSLWRRWWLRYFPPTNV